MYRRSDLRYACARAKNKNATEEHSEALSLVEKKLKTHQRWENFKTTWDLLLDKNNEIVIIDPETDRDFIHSTCLEHSFAIKNNVKLSTFTDRQNNIITIVDAIMLDGKMSWSNYNTNWGIELDPENKMIKTKLFNVSSNQLKVTPEMIKASMKEPEGIIEQDYAGVVVELNSADPDEIEKIKKSLPSEFLDNKE